MSPSTLEGQNLGKYRVLEPLGRGGMAQVYRAYHPQLDRYVAVKVLRSDLIEEEEFLARFQREARAVAALRHPNIVQVYDFDVQDDLYYMVMELLEGDTLKAYMNVYRSQGGNIPYPDMVRILLDVLAGLGYAHHEGITHRDIKPANIMLTRRCQAVVTDFGIAQIVGGTQYTVSGALMGTLNYMAPEQGLKGHGDARSDLYSLGIVFFEMLTGHPPFEADTPLAILMKHLNDPLPLPHKLDPTVPEPFERVVLRALAKQPEDRYASAEEMAQGLVNAANEAGIALSEWVALPLSFAARPVVSEPAPVFSGEARQNLPASPFASDDTDPDLAATLAPKDPVSKDPSKQIADAAVEFADGVAAITRQAIDKIAEQIAAQKASKTVKADVPSHNPVSPASAPAPVSAPAPAGAAFVDAPAAPSAAQVVEQVPMPRGAVAFGPSAEVEPGFGMNAAIESPAAGFWGHFNPNRLTLSQPVLAGIPETPRGDVLGVVASGLVLAFANISAVYATGMYSLGGVFQYGWPFELFLVSGVLGMVMAFTRIAWMIIPLGLVMGNGWILAYYSFTGNWDAWAFGWPVEPLLLGSVIAAAFLIDSNRDENGLMLRRLGRGLAIFSIAQAVLLMALAVVWGLLSAV